MSFSIGRQLFPFLFFVLTGLVLIPLYRYNLNPDATSYLSIADAYAEGRYHDAVNAYWSPLISWLIAGAIKFSISGLLAFRLILLAAGAGAWILAQQLLQRLSVSRTIASLFSFCSFVLLLGWSFADYTPDLLCLFLWLWLISQLTRSDRPANTLLIAGIGFLLYLCKSYSFLLFPIVIITLHFFTHKKFMRTLSILACWLLLCSLWIAALNRKYDDAGIGTAGKLNAALAWVNHSPDQPLFYQGLLVPPNAHAVSWWEDPEPSRYPALHANTQLAASIAQNTLQQLLTFLVIIAKYLLPVLAGMLFLRRKAVQQPLAKQLLLMACLYPLGYLATFIVERYVYLPVLLGMIAGFAALDLLLQRLAHKPLYRTLLIGAVVFPLLYVPLNRLIYHAHEGAAYKAFADALPHRAKLRMASDNACFTYALYGACINKSQYYGITLPGSGAAQVAQQLKQYSIACYCTEKPSELLKAAGYKERRMPLPKGVCYVYSAP